MRSRVAVRLSVLSMLCLVPTSAGATPILNGSFEEHGFASWTVNTPSPGSLLFEGAGGHSGHSAAWFGSISGVDDSITQTFATTPGEPFAIAFWLAHDLTDHANDFRIWWNGTLLGQLVNAGSVGYTRMSYVGTANGPTSSLTFGGRDVLGYYRLDDVDVHSLAATPEPSTFVLLASAALFALVIRLRFRKRTMSQV